MKTFIVVVVCTIAAISETALANQLNPQPEPGKPNPQLTKPVLIPGERPLVLPKTDEQLKIPQVASPKLEPSQQLLSDRLINRTFRFGL